MSRTRHVTVRDIKVPFLLFLTLLLICMPSLASPAYAASPDLTVDSVWLESTANPGQAVASVAPGDQFNIVASVKNIGSAPASSYYLDVYYDSDYGRGGPDNITAGEVQIWYVGPFTAQAGTHTTKWVVDPDNKIAEMSESNNQKEYTFTIGSVLSPPAAPTLLSPADGATGLSSPVMLSWSASSGWVVGYTVYGWRVDTGAVVVYISTAGTSYSASLLSGVTYRWMVAAYNGAGYSSWSTVRSFTVA